MLILELIQNISLLIALVAVSRVLISRMQRNSLRHQILSGLLFGSAGVVGMMAPFTYAPGLIFDGRSIILSVGGLFGGPIVATIAALICSAYRLSIGGSGVWVGVSVAVFSAAAGIMFYQLRSSGRITLNWKTILGIAYFVHIGMLLLFLGFPDGTAADILPRIALPVLTIYPLATLAISMLYLDSEEQMQYRKAIIESEAALKKAQEMTHVGNWTLHIQQDRMVWSEELFRISGIDKNQHQEDLLQTALRIVFAEDREAFGALLQAANNGILPDPFEFRIIRPDGTERILWIECGEIIKDKKGQPERISGVVQDITERRASENELRENESRYRNLIMNSPDAIFVNHQDKVVMVNHACVQLFGAEKPEDLIGMTPFDFFHPDFHERIQARIAHMRTYQEPVAIAEEKIIRLDGRVVDVDVLAAPFLFHGSNDIHVILRDISERKRAEEKLIRSQHNLIEAQRIANTGSYEHDVKTNRVIWSEEAYTILGASKETFDETMDGFIRSVHPNDRERVLRTFHVDSTADKYMEFEFRVVASDGMERIVSQKNEAIFENGEHVLNVGTIQNITERKTMEEALRKSHDLLFRLTEQVPGVVYQYQLDPDGSSRFPIASQGIEDIYEVTPEEVLEDATVVFGRLHPEDYDAVSNAIFESARTLNLFHVEFRVILPRQGLRWRLSNAKPERTANGGTLWYGIITDITDRKLAEQKINDQLDELRRWQSALIGRENRMIELKREVNELMVEAGKPPRYTATNGPSKALQGSDANDGSEPDFDNHQKEHKEKGNPA